MRTAQAAWAVAGIVAVLLLPVGAFRWVAYRSGETDHTPALRGVALMTLGIGGGGFVAFLALTAWFLATGRQPW
jgi:hypothetical protein